jgi:hypothetical protein
MLNVIIDTNVLSSHFISRPAVFNALTSLAKEELIQLHIPYIVEQEYITQLIKQGKDKFNVAKSALNNLQRIPFVNKSINTFITTAVGNLDRFDKSSTNATKTGFRKWIRESKAQIHNIKDNHANRVFEKYFEGTRPFEDIKKRDDIPDAFIYEVVTDISSSLKDVHFICNDNFLNESVSKDIGINTYVSLDEFIKSECCQKLLIEQKVKVRLDDLLMELEKHKKTLKKAINNDYEDLLNYKTFVDDSIPEDNSEATIQGVYGIDDLEFLFDDVIYYGHGIVGIPFSFSTEADCYFCIFKSDYDYNLSAAERGSMSIEDWNDHYYNASINYILIVEGVVTVNLNLANLKNDSPMEKVVKYDTTKIDRITNIYIPD